MRIISPKIQSVIKHADFTKKLDAEQKRIADGVNNGSITKLEARELQAALAKTRESLKASMKDAYITPGENKELTAQLAALNSRVTELSGDKEKRVRTLTPELKLAAMSQRIDQGVKSGALTKAEAKALREQLAGNRSQLQKARANGELTTSELDGVNKRLGELSSSITSNVKNAERVVRTIGPEIRLTVAAMRLNAAVSNGKITEAEAKKMQAMLNNVMTALNESRSDGELTSGELGKVNTQISNLEQMLKSSLGTLVGGTFRAIIHGNA